MQSTTNYQLVKQELTDEADITQISGNWDKIDAEMKRLSDEKFDKSGGTIAGKTTISKGGLDVTGGTTTDSLTVEQNAEVKGVLTVIKNLIAKAALTITGKLTANGGLAVTGGTTTDTLNATGKITGGGGIDVTGNSTFKNNVDVTGILNMSNSIRSTKAGFLQTQANVVRGTNPANTIYNYWSVFDKNGWGVGANRLAHIDYAVDTNGVASLAMYVNKYVAGSTETGAGLYARWNGDTPIIALTHHPAANSNDYSIADTNFVNKMVNDNKTQLVRW